MDSNYTQNETQTPYLIICMSPPPIIPTSSPAVLLPLTHDTTATLNILVPHHTQLFLTLGFAEYVVQCA